MLLKGDPNNAALISETYGEIKYAQLYEQATNFGIKYSNSNSNSLAIIRASNKIGSIVSYISCIENYLPVLLVDYNTSDADFFDLVEAYSPKFIFDSHELALEFYSKSDEIFDYFLYLRDNGACKKINKELALLLPTSGSTGSKKYVRISKGNLISNTESICDYLSLSKKDRAITTMPMSYTYGLSILNSHFFCGGSIVVTEETVFSKIFWNLFERFSVSSISGVPYLWQLLLRAGFNKRDLTKLRYVTQAGGKLSDDLKLEIIDLSKKYSFEFYVMYGQTEATARMSYVPPKLLEHKISSIGIPVPNGTFSLVNVDESGVGELVFTGPNVSMGYANSVTDLDSDDLNKGVLYTGDLARVDNDGFYYVLGRNKRFSKFFGIRISLDELESFLEERFGNNEFLVKEVDNKIYIGITGEFNKKVILEDVSFKTNLNHSIFNVSSLSKIKRNENGKKIYV